MMFCAWRRHRAAPHATQLPSVIATGTGPQPQAQHTNQVLPSSTGACQVPVRCAIVPLIGRTAPPWQIPGDFREGVLHLNHVSLRILGTPVADAMVPGAPSMEQLLPVLTVQRLSRTSQWTP